MHLRGSPAAQHYGTWEASPALPGPGHVNVGEMAHTAFLSWQFRGTAREGATGMSVTASQRNEAGESYAVASVAVGRAGVAALGSLTIPGRPEHVREARAFVAKALGELHPALENAVLLTSELVTNAVMHSASRCSGGTITIEIGESAGGVRIEVTATRDQISAPRLSAATRTHPTGTGSSSCRRCRSSGVTCAATRAPRCGAGSPRAPGLRRAPVSVPTAVPLLLQAHGDVHWGAGEAEFLP